MWASPRAALEKYGNLTYYKGKSCSHSCISRRVDLMDFDPPLEHPYGGHFPALDNPQGLVDHLREFFDTNY